MNLQGLVAAASRPDTGRADGNTWPFRSRPRGPGDEVTQESRDDAAGDLAHSLRALTAPSLGLSFSHSGDVLAVFAAAVGVLLLVQR